MGLGFSFISTIAYGMMSNAPIRTLFAGGIVGMIGWGISKFFPAQGSEAMFSTFAAAAFVSISSQLLSIRLKVPSTIFSIAGIIPLVPGSTAYKAMLALVGNRFLEGITLGTKTMMVAGSIAAGLIFGLSIFTVWKGFVRRYASQSARNHPS